MKARLEGFGKGIDGTEVEIPDSLATTKSQTDNTEFGEIIDTAMSKHMQHTGWNGYLEAEVYISARNEIAQAIQTQLKEAFENGRSDQRILSDYEYKSKLKQQDIKSRIDELDGWFDLPKHYPGEEYRDEPFAKVKCKLPNKIQYYTLDNGFTYALKVRLNELSAGATAESPNNTTTRSKA